MQFVNAIESWSVRENKAKKLIDCMSMASRNLCDKTPSRRTENSKMCHQKPRCAEGIMPQQGSHYVMLLRLPHYYVASSCCCVHFLIYFHSREQYERSPHPQRRRILAFTAKNSQDDGLESFPPYEACMDRCEHYLGQDCSCPLLRSDLGNDY